MAIAKGSKSGIAWAPEVTYGVAPGGNWNYRPYSQESLDESTNRITGEDIRADRATPSARGGNISTSGGITHDFDLVSALGWLRHLFAATPLSGSALSVSAIAGSTAYKRGGYVSANGFTYIFIRGGTTASGVNAASVTEQITGNRQNISAASGSPLIIECIGASAGLNLYSYTITAADSFPVGGLAIEKQVKGGDVNTFIQYLGARLNSVEISLPQEGLCKANWNLVGLKTTYSKALTASGTLTFSGQPANNDTIVIGGKTYTFQTTLTNVDGNVLIGASLAASILNLAAAINLTAGAGTTYAALTTSLGTYSAVAGATTMVVSAVTRGAAGNSIATTDTSANGSWGAVTLTGGSDGTVAGTPTTLIRDPAVGYNGLIDVNDPTFSGATDNQVKWREGSITISNNIDESVYQIGDRYRVDIPEGPRTIQGRLNLYFQDPAYYEIFRNEITVAIGISFIINGEFFIIEIPECKITGNGAPKFSGAGLVTQEFDFTGFKQVSAYDVRIRAVNKQATLPN